MPSFTPEQWTTHQLLTMAARLVQRSHDRVLAELGLTQSTLTALQGLAAGPLSQDQLAARINVQAQTMGKILARLQAAGLITRMRNPRNRRRIEAALTPSGRKTLTTANRAGRNHLSPETNLTGTLRHELLKVIATFSQTTNPGPGLRSTRTPGNQHRHDSTDKEQTGHGH